MNVTDIAALYVGARVVHRDGTVVVLARRKEDDSGWWNVGGGGFSDHALTSDDWDVLREDESREGR